MFRYFDKIFDVMCFQDFLAAVAHTNTLTVKEVKLFHSRSFLFKEYEKNATILLCNKKSQFIDDKFTFLPH